MAQRKIKSETVKNYAREYVEYLQTQHRLPVEQAYLFGSYAKKKTRPWSDIDVCIISKKFQRVDPLEYLWTRRRAVDIERGIEPFGMTPADFVDINPMAYEIKQTGIHL